MIRIKNLLPATGFLTINILMFQNMAKIYGLPFTNNNLRLVCYMALAALAGISVCCEIIHCGGKVKTNSFGCATLCYSTVLLVLLLYHKNIVADVFLNCYMVLFAMIVSYYAFKRVTDVEGFIVAQQVIIVIFWVLYVYNKMFVHQAGAPVLNSIFYVVLLLPFALCAKKQTMQGILVALITIAALASMKRTAVIIVAVCLLIYYSTRRKDDIKKLTAILGASVFFVIVIAILQWRFGINIVDKFRDTAEDGGSGRAEMYSFLIRNLLNRSLAEILFGDGYYAVITLISGTAHNDFLEVLYCFGLVGFGAYIAIWSKLIKVCKRMREAGYRYWLQFQLSIIEFFIMSMFSHVIMIPSYIMLLALFWGMVLGDYRKSMSE